MARVFVSSTCFDLIDVRRELEEQLRELGLQPVLSDRPSSDFAVAGDVHSIESCLVNVRNSDVFVCILSQRYGAVLDAYGYPALSATHVEYREARNALKPIYFYARDQLVAEHGIWRKDKGHFSPRWVKDLRLFDFIEEHQAPPVVGDPERSNWVTSFRDSVELKQTLSRDLRTQSRPALLRKLLDAGRVPFIALARRSGHQQRSDGREVLVANMDLTRHGVCEVFRAKICYQMDGSWTHPIALGDLAASRPTSTTVFFPLATETTPAKTSVQLTYETQYGHALRDTFELVWKSSGDFSVRLTKKELLQDVSYELG